MDIRDLSISRREAIRRGLAGTAAWLAAGAATTQARAAEQPPKAKARSVIQIWLNGAPAQTDTFDPKPEAGSDYCGPLSHPIATNVPGIRIGESLPELAKVADKYSLIRSLKLHKEGYGHETAAYLMLTGREPGSRFVYPSIGAMISLLKGYDAGYKGLIPPNIVITSPTGRFSEVGFLGPRYQSFATGGNPMEKKFAVEGVVAPGVSDEQQKQRRALLRKLDTLGASAKGDATLTAFYQSEEQAYDMILGDGAKAFDLSEEGEKMRERYDTKITYAPWLMRTKFGQCCLAARRLVERGVPYIMINWIWHNWDTHSGHFEAMRTLLPMLDRAVAALLSDLSERGLLESTIVWCGGEHGRTPKVNYASNAGRDHWTRSFSHLIAGGGFKGGQVVGATDAKGEDVKDRPVYPGDLLASIYELMGFDPLGKLPNPMGLPLTITPNPSEGIPLMGRLKEIM